MNFRFIFWPLFGSKVDPESHQNRSKMHPEISSFFRPHFWSISDHFVILFSTLFAASWSSAFHFTKMLKPHISLQIPMNSQGRSGGNCTLFAKMQWISASFLRYFFSIQKSIKKAFEMDPKRDPKRCPGRSRKQVKKHVRKWLLFWRQTGSSLGPFSVRKC